MNPVRIGIALMGALIVLLLGACGSDDSTTATEGGSDAGSLEEVQATVDKLLGPEGTFVEEPTTSPTPAEDKELALISCGQTITACEIATTNAAAAAEELGWSTTLYDTKADPAAAGTAVRNAITEDVDGIFAYFIDCQYMRSALSQAKDAGIPVVAGESFDCNESDPGAPSLFTHVIEYQEGPYIPYIKEWARSQAQYAIANQDGASNAIVFADDTAAGNEPALEGMREAYEACADCTLEEVRFPFSAFGTSLQRIAEQELLKNPDTNTVLTTYEAISLEVYPAAREAGADILVDVGEGGPAGMDLLREGINGFASGLPIDWEGWAAVDALSRLINGEEPVKTGMGLQLVDADHNLPESGAYVPPVDFRAMYRKAWGLE